MLILKFNIILVISIAQEFKELPTAVNTLMSFLFVLFEACNFYSYIKSEPEPITLINLAKKYVLCKKRHKLQK